MADTAAVSSNFRRSLTSGDALSASFGRRRVYPLRLAATVRSPDVGRGPGTLYYQRVENVSPSRPSEDEAFPCDTMKEPTMTTLNPGDSASRTCTISDEMIRGFAELTGDTNPVHLDDAYAAGTRFGRRIAHGMIAAGMISATLANDLPGPGTVYLGQSLQFKLPVYPGDTITATVEVRSVRPDKPIVTLGTVCTNQDGEVVLDGEAVVLVTARP
jgi:3-hydroxybutyryl-CoA dehydratase